MDDRILAVVAPQIADEVDRKALEHEEAQAGRERYFTMTPDGVGCAGPAGSPRRGRVRAGGDRSAVRPSGR
jgi:hypothetical protein